MAYEIRIGTVQAYVLGFSTAPYIQHFGMPEYDVHKPILTESRRRQAETVIADLNTGRISEDSARVILSKILF